MVSRIPPSLNWLVDKRARTHGSILILEKEKSRYLESFEKAKNRLVRDLDALDLAIGLHEIKISPEKIPPNIKGRIENKLKHGELSKLIVEAIERNNNQEATAKEIRVYVAIRASLKLNREVTEESIRISIKNLIKYLCSKGKLVRIPYETRGPRRHYKIQK
ncbi:MAG: hypothetical protein KDI92_11505 [Xanthomonadales bacterium]|nr:hypothetical protein [Xanthomonadales bacterium]